MPFNYGTHDNFPYVILGHLEIFPLSSSTKVGNTLQNLDIWTSISINLQDVDQLRKAGRIMSKIYRESKKASCLIRKRIRIIKLQKTFQERNYIEKFLLLQQATYHQMTSQVSSVESIALLLLLQIDHECSMLC